MKNPNTDADDVFSVGFHIFALKTVCLPVTDNSPTTARPQPAQIRLIGVKSRKRSEPGILSLA